MAEQTLDGAARPVNSKRGVLCDLTGQRFGRLLVVARDLSPRKSRLAHWSCSCDCGRTTVTSGNELRNGGTKSCGCWIRDHMAARQRTHGQTRSPEFKAWGSLLERCENPDAKDYPNYGGRGVRVCERWRNSFENFLTDMGRRPTSVHSVDRKDVNGHYEPGNCRWATRSEQQRNRRCNRMVTAMSQTLSAAEWAERSGISYPTLLSRLDHGWDGDLAVTAPVNAAFRRTKAKVVTE